VLLVVTCWWLVTCCLLSRSNEGSPGFVVMRLRPTACSSSASAHASRAAVSALATSAPCAHASAVAMPQCATFSRVPGRAWTRSASTPLQLPTRAV
jgi:hypothetical protein